MHDSSYSSRSVCLCVCVCVPSMARVPYRCGYFVFRSFSNCKTGETRIRSLELT